MAQALKRVDATQEAYLRLVVGVSLMGVLYSMTKVACGLSWVQVLNLCLIH
jgi:hypothetical protein